MTNYQEAYQHWQNHIQDPSQAAQLASLSPADQEEQFYRPLSFGTGGLRGVLGLGTNRMNSYVVARATQGYCDYLKENFTQAQVVVGYDSRIQSDEFAQVASEVFAGNGIKVHFYPVLMPTPTISFAIRHRHCQGGIVVTASHNPGKYNGYKVYGADGCQITTQGAQNIAQAMEKHDYFQGISRLDFATAQEQGMIVTIGEDTVDAYFQAMKESSLLSPCEGRDISIVYTPLHGAGISCVPRCLAENGFPHVVLVEEQRHPDGNFPTCPYPNPEEKEALALGISWAEKEQSDLVLATDPDCDRVGIAVRHQGGYQLLSGNQVGVLLLEFICTQRLAQKTMPKDPVVVKTIVTTPMAAQIARDYDLSLREVLTGFKFIGEQIGLLEAQGESDRYLFGFEESYGYLSTSQVRDKDAVNGSLLICELVSYWKNRGKTLVDHLEELYQRYGYVQERLLSFAFEGASGGKALAAFMEAQRNTPEEILGKSIRYVSDFLVGKRVEQGSKAEEILSLPPSDVLRWEMEGDTTVILRPSGTEPKLKIYLSVAESTAEASVNTLDALEAYFRKLV